MLADKGIYLDNQMHSVVTGSKSLGGLIKLDSSGIYESTSLCGPNIILAGTKALILLQRALGPSL